MATISYTSFSHDSPDECSPSILFPLEQLSIMEASIPNDLSRVNSSTVPTDENDCGTRLINLETSGFHLAPTTPTKERTRRATMPEPMTHRSLEVHLLRTHLPPPSFISIADGRSI
jgi:hypothetical protein